MSDETTPLPPAPHYLSEQELEHLTLALRSLTNGVLDMRSSVVALAEKIAHLIAAEQTESEDIRELRRQLGQIIEYLFNAAKDIATTAVEVKTTRADLARIEDSGSFQTTTEEELRAEREITVVKALTVLVEKVKGLHPLVKYTSTLITGSTVYHLITKFFFHH